jgi:hypothetical protein
MMMWEGSARWGRDCGCDSCVSRRSEWHRAGAEKRRRENRDQDVDYVVVHRLVTEPKPTVKANRDERLAAAKILFGRGAGASRVAEKLGCTVRTVERYRVELGLAKGHNPPGVTRATVKAAVLADPAISAAELARRLDLANSTVAKQILDLQNDGELPKRDNRNDVRNPRSKGLPRTPGLRMADRSNLR